MARRNGLFRGSLIVIAIVSLPAVLLMFTTTVAGPH